MAYTKTAHYLLLSAITVGILFPFYLGAADTPDYQSAYRHERLLAQLSLALLAIVMTVLLCRYGNRTVYAGWPYKMFHPDPDGSRRAALIGLLLSSYLIVAVAVAYVALQAFPNSADEYDYLFHAMTFSAGRLWNDPPVLPEFFEMPWMVIKDNKWTTQYDPGWPSVLALAMTIGLPAWLVGPLVGALSLGAFFVLARRVEGEGTALPAAALCAVTPFFIFNTASYFNHALTGLFGLSFVYFMVRSLQSHSYRHAVLAGVFLGALGVTRLYSAILFVLPVLLIIGQGGLRPMLRRGFGLAVGGMPFLVALMTYNFLVTGNPLLPVKSWGYPNPQLYPIASLLIDGGLRSSLMNTSRYLVELGDYVWPLFLIMYAGALVHKLRTRTIRFYDWYLLIFVIGFLAFAEGAGNRYGPRYYFEVFPFAVLTVCSAVAALVRSRDRDLAAGSVQPTDEPRANLRIDRSSAMAVHLLAAQVLIGALNIPFLAWLQHRIVDQRMDLFEQVEAADISNAVVFIESSTGVIRQMPPRDLIRNGVDLTGEVIYALDRGKRNACLVHRFPDRAIWTYRREGNAREGALERLPEHAGDVRAKELEQC